MPSLTRLSTCPTRTVALPVACICMHCPSRCFALWPQVFYLAFRHGLNGDYYTGLHHLFVSVVGFEPTSPHFSGRTLRIFHTCWLNFRLIASPRDCPVVCYSSFHLVDTPFLVQDDSPMCSGNPSRGQESNLQPPDYAGTLRFGRTSSPVVPNPFRWVIP